MAFRHLPLGGSCLSLTKGCITSQGFGLLERGGPASKKGIFPQCPDALTQPSL